MNAAPEIRAAIVDSNGAIGLAKAGCFSFLPAVFDVLLVPPAVVREVTDPISAPQLKAALADWLTCAASSKAMGRVPDFGGPADREALALALDNSPCVILTGDRQLIGKARQLGVLCVNPPLFVQSLAEAGLIPAAKPYLDQMIRRGFGIPIELYTKMLTALGERG